MAQQVLRSYATSAMAPWQNQQHSTTTTTTTTTSTNHATAGYGQQTPGQLQAGFPGANVNHGQQAMPTQSQLQYGTATHGQSAIIGQRSSPAPHQSASQQGYQQVQRSSPAPPVPTQYQSLAQKMGFQSSVVNHQQSQQSLPAPPVYAQQQQQQGVGVQSSVTNHQQLQRSSPAPPLPAQAQALQQGVVAPLSSLNYNNLQQPPSTPLPPADCGQQIALQGNAAFTQTVQQPPSGSAWDMQQLQQSIVAQTTSTTNQVHQAVTIQEGGTARQQAASQGSQALTRFDEMISRLLISSDSCSNGFAWIRMRHGYLCEGGHHYVRHKEVDKWAFSGGSSPLRILHVNTNGQVGAVERYPIKIAIHPPRSARIKTSWAHSRFMGTLVYQEEHEILGGVCDCVELEDLDRHPPYYVGMPKLVGEEDVAEMPEYMDRQLPWFDATVSRERRLREALR